MPIKLHNTLTRKKDIFVPGDEKRVTMYVCGPTVYSYAHIGNARPPVVFDVLYRVLKRRYANVVYARNITDLDDKIYRAASDQGVPIGEITERFTAAYHEDLQALGVAPPTMEPRATAHIGEMVALIERLIASEHAYVEQDHVLFAVARCPDYGRLSGRDRREQIAGARVEVAPYKRDPADFVLWKPSSDDVPGWPSPWGYGRPGWHTECSAMIAAHLGETIDIHGGGNDLIFPHHENEVGQSSCAHGGAPLARYWLHNGHLNVNQEKMSKSLGNVLLVRDLLAQAQGEVVRFALLTTHYRKPLEWNDDTMARAQSELDRCYAVLRDLGDEIDDSAEPPEGFFAALEDDLNTPLSRAKLFDVTARAESAQNKEEKARLAGQMLAAGRFLGILQHDPLAWFSTRPGRDHDADEIERLIAARNAARAGRDFAQADEIRDQLEAMGVALEDSPQGTRWKIAG